MSIWSTRYDAEIPPRDDYGRPGRGARTYIDVATSSMSDVIRFSIDTRRLATEALLTPDEARRLATALVDAADEYTDTDS